MAKTSEMLEVNPNDLKPYEKNAKIHGADQVEKLKASITEFSFISPCLIDKDNNIIAGHGRVLAAKALGLQKVPCVRIEGLTDEQRRAYILADNKLTELGSWDMDILEEELRDLDAADFIVELTGFEMPEGSEDWFSARDRWDNSREENNDEYNEFLDKFEQPKTTDDCYTPDNIYEIIAEYVANRYKKDRALFVRPFYPGGDYQNERYAPGSVVVDNPPFSLMAEIVDFYIEKGQAFFIFAPGVAAFNYISRPGITAVATFASVTYENGANVQTSFITNMEPDGIAAFSDPAFYKAIETTNKENEAALRKSLPKYEFPAEVLTASRMGYLSKYGEALTIKREDAVFIRTLDAMKELDKGIFGGALLLSERAAAERAAAERAAAERAAATCWPLSEREREIVKSLGGSEA